MIIDCHTHLNNYHDEKTASLEASIRELQLQMRRNRVDIAMVLTSYKVTPGRPSTREVVEATRDVPSLQVVAGLSYASFSSETVAELREFLTAGAIRGLKLYPGYEPFYPADPKFRPAYELAAEFGVPVMVHTGDTYAPTGKVKFSHPLNIDEVAVDFPMVNFIICHLGNPWMRDTMEVVYKNANVYTDISGLVLGNFSDRFERYMLKQLQEMLLFGVEPDKVLFGSDWPIASMQTYIEFMEGLKVPELERRKIMFENAARLFRVKAPVATGGAGGLRGLFRSSR